MSILTNFVLQEEKNVTSSLGQKRSTGLAKKFESMQLDQNTMESYKSNCDLVLKQFPRGSGGLASK